MSAMVGIRGRQSFHRSEPWTREQIDATPAQFRKTLTGVELDDAIGLAKYAGRKMAEHMAKAKRPYRLWRVKDLDPAQVEHWRARFCVPKNRTSVMLAVAWSTLRRYHLRHSIMPKRERWLSTIGEAKRPATTAKKMIFQYGPEAEKYARRFAKGRLKRNRRYWLDVVKAIKQLRRETKVPVARMSLARQGAAHFCSYLAARRRSLRAVSCTNEPLCRVCCKPAEAGICEICKVKES